MTARPVTLTIRGEFKSLVALALDRYADTFGRPETDANKESTPDLKATWIKNRDALRALAAEIRGS